MAVNTRTYFDRDQWRMLTRDGQGAVWDLYRTFFEEGDKYEDRSRTAWALNNMSTFCRTVCGSDDPREVDVDDPKAIRAAFDVVTEKMSLQVRKKCMYILRQMLAAAPSCSLLLERFPRRLGVAPDPVRRQQVKVYEDILPAKVTKDWMLEVFREIIDHRVATTWKTSATAHQHVSKAHRVLRTLGCWNDSNSKSEFESQLKTLTAPEIERMYQDFTSNCVPVPVV